MIFELGFPGWVGGGNSMTADTVVTTKKLLGNFSALHGGFFTEYALQQSVSSVKAIYAADVVRYSNESYECVVYGVQFSAQSACQKKIMAILLSRLKRSLPSSSCATQCFLVIDRHILLLIS